ncbi:copper amine oxidase N-terminal domain-containing protein [Paenibacillus marinisediminis]
MNRLTQKIIMMTLVGMLALAPIQVQAKSLSNPVTVSLDNKIIGQGYISENGNTMIPLRILSENLHYKVKWDNKEKEATISKDNKYIKFTVNYHNAEVNDGFIQLSSRPEMKNNTVYVPLRVVSDALGLQIGYVNRTAYISTSSEPIKLPTATTKIPLKEVPSLFLSNGYEKFGADGISYVRRAIEEDGAYHQTSFAQVVPEMQLMTLSLHENNSEDLDFAKLLLNSVVPTKANEIYKIISTQDIIPLQVIKSDGYQVAIMAKDDHSSLDFTFDGTKDGEHINRLKRDVEASKGR